jgi:hypothetical protein
MNNDVFEVVEGNIVINDFNKMIPEFRILTTQQDLLYVYHMGSYRSPYSNYDPDNRKASIIKDFCPDLVISKFHQDAIDKFIQFQQTPSMRYLDANIIGMDKITKFLTTVNLNDVDDKGKLLYKPTDITNPIKEAGKIIEALQTLREKVKKEQSSDGTARGGYKPNDWE